MNPHIDIRIDIKHTFFHYFGFIFSYRFSRCDNLAVQIGQAYLVIIDQIKRSHTTPHKCFADIASDAANTKDSHSGMSEFLHRLFSQ